MSRIAIACIALVAATVTHAADPAAAAASRAAELEVLKNEAGIWDALIEFPPATPDAKPTVMHGVQTNTFVTGNGWIKNDFEVDATYGGHGTWGFDAKKRKFVGIWVDSNQDYIRLDEGVYDAEKREMTWSSELRQPDPYPPAKYTMIERFAGDTRTLTMSAISPKSGKVVPLGRITFTKRREHGG